MTRTISSAAMMRTALLSVLAISASSQGKKAGHVLHTPVILGHLVMQYIDGASECITRLEGVMTWKEYRWRGDRRRRALCANSSHKCLTIVRS